MIKLFSKKPYLKAATFGDPVELNLDNLSSNIVVTRLQLALALIFLDDNKRPNADELIEAIRKVQNNG